MTWLRRIALLAGTIALAVVIQLFRHRATFATPLVNAYLLVAALVNIRFQVPNLLGARCDHALIRRNPQYQTPLRMRAVRKDYAWEMARSCLLPLWVAAAVGALFTTDASCPIPIPNAIDGWIFVVAILVSETWFAFVSHFNWLENQRHAGL